MKSIKDIPFNMRHGGPFEARNSSVFDKSTGTYILYCKYDHNGNPLIADKNAEAIAYALNKVYVDNK